MNASVDPDSPTGRQARAWALAVLGEPFPPERSAQLGAWLRADPSHAKAYEEAEALLLAIGQIDLLARPALPRRTSPAVWIVAGTAVAAGLVAAVVLAVPAPSPFEAGTQARQVSLNDGSTALLAPGGRLARASRWPWDDRRYVLERGEAFFAVRKAGGRRFQVAVGQTQVEVLGTRFDARAGASGQVRVAVEEGKVAVYALAGAERRRAALLGAGDYVVIENGRAQAGRLAAPGEAAPWRSGRLAYADAPLGDVVVDLAARGRSALRVTPRAGALRVTASFQLDQADRFVASLPEILPVSVRASADGVRTIDVTTR